MTPERLLPLEIQLISLGVLGAFSAWVLWLIRTQRLHLREALIWLITTLAAIAVTAFPRLLQWGAHLVGVQVPANALFGAGILYLAVNVLAVTIAVSTNTTRLRRIAQECALLRTEIETLRRASSPPVSSDGAQSAAATPEPDRVIARR